MAGARRAAVLAVVIAVTAAPADRAFAAGWSRPVVIAPRHFNPHDAVAVWTTGGHVVAVANLQVPEQFAAFTSPGTGAFTAFGRLADHTPDFPHLVATPDGGVIAAYGGADGAYTATSSGGRPFPTAKRLEGSDFASVPFLRAAPNGDVFAFWQTALCDSGCPPRNSVLVAARRAGASEFDSPQQLSAPGLQSGAPQLVTDRNGGAIVAWVTGRDGSVDNLRLVYSIRPPSGAFGPERVVDPRPGVSGFRLASRPDGRAVISVNWLGVRPVEVASGTVGGGFGTPIPVGARSGDGARVALGPSGGGLIGWLEGARPRSIRVAALRSGGVSRPRTLARGDVQSLKLRIDARGRRIVGWRERGRLHVATWTGARRPAQQVLGRRDSGFYSLASTSRGIAIVVWSRSANGLHYANAAVAVSGKRFGRPARLETPNGSPGGVSIATGPGGRALAYWVEIPNRGFNNTLVARYYKP